jgi:anti-sigma factor RsiW
MSACADVIARLSEFVDDDLSSEAAQEVADHLSSCASCRAVADDLRRLKTRSATLGGIDPPPRAWRNIEQQLLRSFTDDREAPAAVVMRRRTPPWLAAAAAAVLVAGLAYGARRLILPATSVGGNAPAAGSVKALGQELMEAERHYERAIAELEAIAKQRDGLLDPKTSETLRKSLVTIDAAIDESRRALATEPENEPARASLFDALHTKVTVLQTAVALDTASPDAAQRDDGVATGSRHK